MGAWGYEPMDSDQALDWLGQAVTDTIGHRIRILIDRFWDAKRLAVREDKRMDQFAYRLRAAADVVLKLNFFSNEDLYGDLHELLAQALVEVMESSWPDEWDDPLQLRLALARQISALRDGMQSTTLADNLDAALAEGQYGGSDPD